MDSNVAKTNCSRTYGLINDKQTLVEQYVIENEKEKLTWGSRQTRLEPLSSSLGTTMVERCRNVPFNHLDQQMRSTRVFVNEGAHIVNESRYKGQGTLVRLLLD